MRDNYYQTTTVKLMSRQVPLDRTFLPGTDEQGNPARNAGLDGHPVGRVASKTAAQRRVTIGTWSKARLGRRLAPHFGRGLTSEHGLLLEDLG